VSETLRSVSLSGSSVTGTSAILLGISHAGRDTLPLTKCDCPFRQFTNTCLSVWRTLVQTAVDEPEACTVTDWTVTLQGGGGWHCQSLPTTAVFGPGH